METLATEIRDNIELLHLIVPKLSMLSIQRWLKNLMLFWRNGNKENRD